MIILGVIFRIVTDFNTFFSFAVDYEGKTVMSVEAGSHGESSGPISGKITPDKMGNVRMYQLDNIKTMDRAFYDGLRVVDGWYGFYNSGYINLPNGKLNNEEIYVNNVINNEARCGFIDLYPDRSLFSFIPKPNRYRKRIERNWDCGIVYPYKNDYVKFNEVNENDANAVKIIDSKVIYNNVGDAEIVMHSLLRHTLSPGDEIRLYYSSGGTREPIMYPIPITVLNVGNEVNDDAGHYFSIKYYDVNTICFIDNMTNKVKGEDNKEIFFFYRKMEDGYEDRYYFRKFKKVGGPDYTQNKVAFGENIYGDRIAQVIFTDDVDVTGLKDNVGRQLSKAYFTAIKTNRGYKEWYEIGDLSADTVEYSHCFGDVTSGLDLPASGSTDYNVRKLYNVFTGDCASKDTYQEGLKKILEDAPTGDYYGTPMPLESGITIDDFDEYYGDIVEFSKTNFTETTIEKVYHRFNTAQRECVKNSKYFNINYDELLGDQYDVGPETGFSVSSKALNEITEKGTTRPKKFPGNINPEGYFYSPFHEVILKELNDDVDSVAVRRVNFVPSAASSYTENVCAYTPFEGITIKPMTVIRITSPVPYSVISNQPFCIYDVKDDETFRGYLSGVSGLDYFIALEPGIKINDEYLRGATSDASGKSRYIISIIEDNCPIYAEFVPTSQKLVWRDVKKMSELTEQSQIYNMPFINGRNYIQENINFFVRRQDPKNKYHLLRPCYESPLYRFQIEGETEKKLDFDYIKEITDTMINAC